MPLAGESAPDVGPVRSYEARRSRQDFAEFNNKQTRPKTATEIAAEQWLAYEKGEEEKRERAEQRRRDEQNRRRAAEQREAERKQRLAQFELAEALEQDMRDRLGIETPKQVWKL